MKRIITTGILAAIISVGSLFAQSNSDKTVYVIDHKIIENFDGSQLLNKAIANYQVYDNNNVHIIFTSDFTKTNKIKHSEIKSESGVVNVVSYDAKGNVVASTKIEPKAATGGIVDKDGVIYVVDGKVVTASTVNALDKGKITSIQVIKDKNNSDYQKYAKEVTKYAKVVPEAITVISTSNNNEVIYVIDGECVSVSDFKTISSSKIAAMKVIKTKDDPNFQKYAKEGTSTVMMITTK